MCIRDRKHAVSHLERYLEKNEGVAKGCVVLATVYGDVHDIGKNLIKTILANNGYAVHDLGKQVMVNTIVDRAIELKACLLYTSPSPRDRQKSRMPSSA